jgi:hypothetical protein
LCMCLRKVPKRDVTHWCLLSNGTALDPYCLSSTSETYHYGLGTRPETEKRITKEFHILTWLRLGTSNWTFFFISRKFTIYSTMEQ